jgi:beta-phosphoglucomutase
VHGGISESRGLAYDRGKFKHLLGGRSPVEGVRILQEAYGFEGKPEELVKERSAIAEKHFRRGVEFVKGFQQFHDRIRSLYKTCVATSLDKALLEIVDRQLGIFSLFHGNVFSIADVGYVSKPNPRLFLYSAAKLQSEPASCVVIEDSPNGIEAARRAGMNSIALTSTYGRDMLVGASMIVDEYSEVTLDKSQFPPNMT